jgi:hypothetical protein
MVPGAKQKGKKKGKKKGKQKRSSQAALPGRFKLD